MAISQMGFNDDRVETTSSRLLLSAGFSFAGLSPA
jgi:hypothetical protein